MDAITQLLKINIPTVVISIFIIIIGLKAGYEALEWLCLKFLKIEFKRSREKREEHELLIKTAHGLTDLSKQRAIDVEQSVTHDKMIKDDLEKLTQMFINKEIDDIRWEVLDFASALSIGRSFSKEQFNHVLSLYSKYEKILEDNNMENGLVTASMEVINEIYKENLKTGFL